MNPETPRSPDDDSIPRGTPSPPPVIEARPAAPLASLIASPVPAPLGPTRSDERIITLDVLRGFALFGILLVNIGHFIRGAMDLDRLRWWELPATDGLSYLFVDFFGSYKFVSLFSMLFGMGIALQGRRADAAGRPFAGRHIRRMLILLAFGVFHGVLLWYGDILTMYALLGMIALLFRRARPITLLIVAAILFLAPVVALTGFTALNPQPPPESFTWTDLANEFEREISEAQPIGDGESQGDAVAFFRRAAEFMDREVELYGEGPWHLAVLHRAGMYAFINMKMGFFLLGWRCIAMMLVGIALINSGIMLNPSRHRTFFLVLAAVGFTLGGCIEAIGFTIPKVAGMTAWTLLAYQHCIYVGALGLALGYLGLVALGTIRERRNWLLRPLAAAGRMALTNYIGQSVICNLIFYSVGLGLIVQLRFAWTIPLTVGIFALQLALSPLWLSRFQFGPLEWVWRSLTYGKRQPMLRGEGSFEF